MRTQRIIVGCVVSFFLGAMGLLAIAQAADAPPPQIPTCDKKIGTLAVTEPENNWWTAYQLDSPEALIKVFVSQSNCFTLLDRGKGLAAAEKERALSANGEYLTLARFANPIGSATNNTSTSAATTSR